MDDLDDLDCFDEESCRFFLREVGLRVVPNYPFSYGMEEVYSLIVEEYGFNAVPDVTSVLQELLEENDVATGIGDEGDIWRSWRHNWRHRNDDALDPHIPRVGNFILPYPSKMSSRRKRAHNFVCKQLSKANRNTASRYPTQTLSPAGSLGQRNDHVISSPTHGPTEMDQGLFLTSATYSHQRCRLGLPAQSQHYSAIPDQQSHLIRRSIVNSVTTASDSQQEFAEVTASMLDGDFDTSRLLSFEMLNDGNGLNQPDSRLRGGEAPVCTLLPIDNRKELETEIPGYNSLPRDSTDNTAAITSCSPIPQDVFDREGRKLRQEEDCVALSRKQWAECFPEPETLCQATSHENCHSNVQTVTPAETPEPQRRRTANRHARLIDGAIFPFKRRRSNAARSSTDVQEAVTPEAGRHSLFRLSWTPTRQNSNWRRSWLQGFRSFFRSSHQNPSETLSKHRKSCSIGNSADAVLGMSNSQKRMTSNTPSQLSQSRLNLDGAYDEVSSPSGSYLNKPLPLNPDEIVKSMSSRTQSIATRPSPFESYQPHSASTTSTSISQTSSKRDFRTVAKDLVSSQDPGMHYSHYPQLSPVHESRLNPAKYDPEKSPMPPISPASFTSFAQRNPFTESFEPLTPRPNLPVETQSLPKNPVSSNGLPPSRSEPNLRPLSSPRMPHAAYYSPPNLPQTPPPSSPDNTKQGWHAFRGRSLSREAPREFETLDQGSGTSSPSKQVKRSRSPVKRLLALAKSSSMKEHNTPSAPNTPVPYKVKTPTAVSSTKKSSLKQWSDKFRHGFLSTDQEEVKREAHVEKYLEDALEPGPEPPSTFPISLDPAYQARLQADVELLICVSANKFLLNEAQHGRISKDTVTKIRRCWESKNRPQVLEYSFDQITQRELILANFRTVQFQGPYANDPIALNSTMLSWGTMGKEMSVRTFCTADSAIRKQLHDAQRVLEMLGAPLPTCLAFEQLHVRAMAMINKQQKERYDRMRTTTTSHARNNSGVSKTSQTQHGPFPRRDYSDKSNWIPHHRRNLSEGDCGVIRAAEDETIEEKVRRMNATPTPPPQLKVRRPTGSANVGTGRGGLSNNSSPTRFRERYHANTSIASVRPSVEASARPSMETSRGSPENKGW